MREEPTIENEILRLLTEKGRGRIFFAQEFYDLRPESSVRFTLSGMAASGTIARLARGVFIFPELTEHGMKMVLPDTESIANAIADKTKVRIVPYGDQAAYLVGLTSVQFSSSTYLTDGAPRRIHLSNGRTIEFRHTSEMRIFAFTSRKMQLISNAMRALGRDKIKQQEREALKWHLDAVSAKDFERDIHLCPEWVRDILLDLKVN
ncbi:MAG: hypothetical protein IJ161_10255 [Bacteroidales bacterium]|nr:hypothetical protein [Bacteroidales bacterium]